MKLMIVHVDTGREWRGGQQQAANLHAGLIRSGMISLMVSPPESPMQRWCCEQGLPHAPLKMRGEIDLPAVLKLASYGKPHVVILQAHTAHAHTLCMLARLLNRDRRVIAVRRVDFHTCRSLFSRWKYHSRLVDRVVCISDAIRRVLIEDGIPREKLTVIRSAVDCDRFKDATIPGDFRRIWRIPDSHHIVGTVAALVDHKDYPNLVSAAGLVCGRRNDVTFMAVGSGPLEAEVRRQIRDTGLEERFILAGQQRDVGPFLKSFTLFVMPSKFEGLGTSVLDAMGLGLPVIGTDAGGIPEMIRHELDGLLVPNRNPQQLAEAILRVIGDPALRESLSKAAQARSKAFGVENQVLAYRRLYDEFIS